MNTLEQQYNEQLKEIKKRYRKRKLRQTVISGIIAIILLGFTYMGYKNLIEIKDMTWVMAGIFGFGALAIAIRTPFYQTHNEYIELRDLNSAYTHERFRNRNG